MRFDIPVVGLKTLKVMKSAGVTALAALVLYLWLRRRGGKVFMEL